MKRTYKKNNKKRNYSKTYKKSGAGVASSKPSTIKYPPLPPSPTNKPTINTNNTNLNIPLSNNEKRKRYAPLGKRIRIAREGTFFNKIRGYKPPKLEHPANNYFPITK
jgi:hypothetical protein